MSRYTPGCYVLIVDKQHKNKGEIAILMGMESDDSSGILYHLLFPDGKRREIYESKKRTVELFESPEDLRKAERTMNRGRNRKKLSVTQKLNKLEKLARLALR